MGGKGGQGERALKTEEEALDPGCAHLGGLGMHLRLPHL